MPAGMMERSIRMDEANLQKCGDQKDSFENA